MIVADYKDERLLTMAAPDDRPEIARLQDDISIPTALVTLATGAKLRKAAAGASKAKGSGVIVELDWKDAVTNPDDRVEWELCVFWEREGEREGWGAVAGVGRRGERRARTSSHARTHSFSPPFLPISFQLDHPRHRVRPLLRPPGRLQEGRESPGRLPGAGQVHRLHPSLRHPAVRGGHARVRVRG